jgi:hypothetical protein
MKTTIHTAKSLKARAKIYDNFWVITLDIVSEIKHHDEIDFFFDNEREYKAAKKAFYNIETHDYRT